MMKGNLPRSRSEKGLDPGLHDSRAPASFADTWEAREGMPAMWLEQAKVFPFMEDAVYVAP